MTNKKAIALGIMFGLIVSAVIVGVALFDIYLGKIYENS